MKSSIRKSIDIFALLHPEMKELIEKRDFNGLKALLKDIRSIDIAEGWRHLSQSEKIIVFRLLGTHKAVELFEDLRFEEQDHIINNLNGAEASAIINEMAPDERADLFKELPEKIVKKLFALMRKEEVQDVNALMKYDEGTAGSLMTTEFIELKKDMSAKQALVFIQESLRVDSSQDINSVYVTDENHKLVGCIALQDLLKSPPDIHIKEIMTSSDLIRVDAHTEDQEVASHFKKYDLLDVPVVDRDNTLVGMITIDDVIDMIEKETTKDIYEIGKMDPRGGEIISYSHATSVELLRRRAGWLILLLVFDFLTGTVLKSFEETLSTVVALTFFIPMLLDTGGNAGNQTSITLIRGLATGDVNFKNVFRIVKLELLTALMMGAVVGLVAFARAMLLQQDPTLSVVVGITMLLITILAISTGVFLPLFSKKIGLDPAVLAGPITTSVVDVLGLIIYFKVAQMFIPALRF